MYKHFNIFGGNMAHNWSIADEKAALKVCLDGLPRKEAYKIAEGRGIQPGPFEMRIRNFKYLSTDGKEGMSKYSKQSKQVWEEYKKTGEL